MIRGLLRRLVESKRNEDRGSDELPVVRLDLWRDDAIVLYDWLMTVDLDVVPIAHRAQRQALLDLLTQLDWSVDPDDMSDTQVARAQAAVAKAMPG
jgi:hypothetical protein